MPAGLRNVCAFVLHYQAQFYGYLYLLSDRYPYSGPVMGSEPPEPEDGRAAPPWPFAWRPAGSEQA